MTTAIEIYSKARFCRFSKMEVTGKKNENIINYVIIADLKCQAGGTDNCYQYTR
ncbi:hypothetical protein PTH_2593 [Pelotomaculum thermopropionicum SI]|uniref:Uncharacterized protein n=1 Tax=Pelotomaculum thermopropionicum (strain DSM 13744 / JCM 10971 / SI) TaxID=370438 RepID=A5CZ27_PELTS|nr:hypothetical protein PTH_2593 [Pelotomaculum thermopropionicum SI]